MAGSQMLCAGKTTAWLPTKNTPPLGPTVNSVTRLAWWPPERDSDGLPSGANRTAVGAEAGAAFGATRVSEHPDSMTPSTSALATTTQ